MTYQKVTNVKTPTFIIVLKSFKNTDSSFKRSTYDSKFSKYSLNVPEISELPSPNSTIFTNTTDLVRKFTLPYQSWSVRWISRRSTSKDTTYRSMRKRLSRVSWSWRWKSDTLRSSTIGRWTREGPAWSHETRRGLPLQGTPSYVIFNTRVCGYYVWSFCLSINGIAIVKSDRVHRSYPLFEYRSFQTVSGFVSFVYSFVGVTVIHFFISGTWDWKKLN